MHAPPGQAALVEQGEARAGAADVGDQQRAPGIMATSVESMERLARLTLLRGKGCSFGAMERWKEFRAREVADRCEARKAVADSR
jgi:hypothetical protein